MVIQESKVAFASRHVLVESHQRTESLKAWVGAGRPDFEGERAARGGEVAARGGEGGDRVRLSAKASAAWPETASKAEKPPDDAALDDADLEPKYLLLKLMIERLLKTKIRLVDNRQAMAPAAQAAGHAAATPAQASPDGAKAARAQRAGYGMEYDLTESRRESESATFEASGVVKTADGRQIDFSLKLSMTREYFSETSVSVRAGDAVLKDPLVINFNGKAAELSSARFAFDLDADGESEQLALLGANSAFLAFDKNEDGKVNDGHELFGALTGNGFAELALYDSDANGWIDERDAMYDQLRTWSGGADAEGGLRTLKEAGVGAIHIGREKTPFSLKSADNELLGSVKSTGVFLGEDGSVGTVQQIDLAV